MAIYSTGLELILNACEGVLQIVVTDDEKPLSFEEWFLPQKASEILAPALQEILKRLDVKIDQFRRIGCFCGPGSFTGIRLALSTAAAIRRVTKAQLGSLDYLQALATTTVMRRGLLYPEKIFVLTHARRNLAHVQEFISYGPQIPAQPVSEATLQAPEKVLETISPLHCYVCGSALSRYPELFALPHTGQGPEGAPDAVLLPEVTKPDLAALCLLARHGDYFYKDLEPKYIRSCDAIDHLEEIAEKQNIDGKEAQEILNKLLTRQPESDI